MFLQTIHFVETSNYAFKYINNNIRSMYQKSRSGSYRHIHAFFGIFRHIQTYSSIFRALRKPDTFRTLVY